MGKSEPFAAFPSLGPCSGPIGEFFFRRSLPPVFPATSSKPRCGLSLIRRDTDWKQLCMGNAIKISRQNRVDHLGVPHQDGNLSTMTASRAPALRVGRRVARAADRPRRSAPRPAIRSHLHHAIFYARNSQRPELAISFRNQHAPDRPGTIRLVPELFRQFVQPPLLPVRLDVRGNSGRRLPVHRRSLRQRMKRPLQNVFAIQLVVQQIEPIARRVLCFAVCNAVCNFPTLTGGIRLMPISWMSVT